jgi:hypothetical protein
MERRDGEGERAEVMLPLCSFRCAQCFGGIDDAMPKGEWSRLVVELVLLLVLACNARRFERRQRE